SKWSFCLLEPAVLKKQSTHNIQRYLTQRTTNVCVCVCVLKWVRGRTDAFLSSTGASVFLTSCFSWKDEDTLDKGKRLNLVKHRFNLTIDGVHVQQRVTGCEVLEDGQPALIMFRDGSNGQDADSLLYNMTHFTYAVREGWEIQWDALKKTSFQMLYSNIYLPFCVRTLQHFLEREKHLVMRRVKPRLRFITRQVVGGAQVTCLATDFYPRHINLSLLRDGQPVDEGELRIGSVLPNGNGLYQVRKTLMVDEKELQRKHNYTCEASHLKSPLWVYLDRFVA
uniref:Ig-like domain-containing protein n=1 Tax=Pundamilia nyererei TaxID=303518 RepID=A0A3B4G7U5_9CICH